MPEQEYKPRFSFEVTELQFFRAQKLLGGYGIKKVIFGKLLDEVLDMVDRHGGMAIGVLMSGNIDVKEIMPSMKEVKDLGEKMKGGEQDG